MLNATQLRKFVLIVWMELNNITLLFIELRIAVEYYHKWKAIDNNTHELKLITNELIIKIVCK